MITIQMPILTFILYLILLKYLKNMATNSLQKKTSIQKKKLKEEIRIEEVIQ